MKLILIPIFIVVSLSANFTLHKHPIETGSRCLDGSPAALYTYVGQDKQNILVYFQAGGTCVGIDLPSTIQDCYKRSKTHLGSSLNFSSTRDFDNYNFLSSKKQTNPLFYSWSKVFIPYCDGSLHQGSRKQPIQYKDGNLYFRGTNNTLNHFEYIAQQLGFYNAENTVVAGTSAGAVAAMMWGNWIYQHAKYPSGVLLISDSGLFITDFVNPWNMTNALYQIVNTEIQIPFKQCLKDYPGRKQCSNAGIIPNYLIPPTFLIQSQYDMWGVGNILQLRCAPNSKPSNFAKCNASELAAIQQYRSALIKSISNFTKYQKNGVWAIGCAQHGFIQENDQFINSYKYEIDGKTILQTFQRYIFNYPDSIKIDQLIWPNNKGCNGIKLLRTNQ